MMYSQWSKMWIVFWGGDCLKFDWFPLETCLLMVKNQKLAKSVGGNDDFWFNSDLGESRYGFWGYIANIIKMALPTQK